MINAFYDRVERDDLLSVLFPGGVSTEHREHVTTWWIEVFGGPADYTAGLGGYEAMLHHHRDLAITHEQRLRFVELMSRAADDAELPDDPEFRAALVGYLEWGTRLAMHNSQPDAAVVEHAPVPRWGWGVAPPYTP
jgi:hemoglobin